MAGPCEVSGPLGEFAEGFRAELADLGYSLRGSEAQLRLMGHLSGWLGARGFSAGDLTGEVSAQFVAARRGLYSSLRSQRALDPLLGYLRGRGVAPVAVMVSPAEPSVVERFAQYLLMQRGLAPATVRSYVAQVRPFLAAHEGNGGGWASLTARQVAVFVTGRAVGQRPRSVGVGVNALRALLRWMWLEGMVPMPLADTIGSLAAPTGTGLAKALTTGQVGDLLAALPANGAVRLRDEAMLALMWRLGLRAGEVASLRLEDIDWRVGVVAVRGKGNRREQVPLPVDVGELIAAYLQRGRPVGRAHRQVFLAVDAPHRPLGAGAVSSVAARAMTRAGIAGPGAAHRLRHTAACRVLAGGGGLVEAGQLLRHASAAATAVYAKSDLTALTALTRPWPVEVGR